MDYASVDASFYEDQCNSLNPIRSWFHTSRHKLVELFVKESYVGGKILDIACGSCLWNKSGFCVTGLDVNKSLLESAVKSNRLSDYHLGEIQKNNFRDGEFSLIVSTEFLEHCSDYIVVVREINRLLKKGGKAVITVPYDTFFSLWKPFFKMQCFIQGTLRGDEYYKSECGHVNHFSPRTISAVFKENGFKIVKLYNHSFFTIGLIAEKIS